MIFVGVDGGATHTRVLAMDEGGRLFRWDAEGSSHELLGMELAVRVLKEAVSTSLARLPDEGLTAVFALAGADTAAEIGDLQGRLHAVWPAAQIQVTNDTEAALGAGAPDPGPAVVVVAGTGANAGARTAGGTFRTLRGKGFEQGNYGGGFDLTRAALHAAFRSEEGSGPKTRLQEEVLALSAEADFDALSERTLSQPASLYRLVQSVPPSVCLLAGEGDDVAQALLTDMGKRLAGSAVGAAMKAGLAVGDSSPPLPVVMAGSLFGPHNPWLEDAFRLEVHRHLISADCRRLERDPVRGALLLAIRACGERTPDRERMALSAESLP